MEDKWWGAQNKTKNAMKEKDEEVDMVGSVESVCIFQGK